MLAPRNDGTAPYMIARAIGCLKRRVCASLCMELACVQNLVWYLTRVRARRRSGQTTNALGQARPVNGPAGVRPRIRKGAAVSRKAVEGFLREVSQVATLPEVSTRILGALNDPDTDIRDLHALFGDDPALSANLLKLANSAFYGLPHQIEDIDRAIVLLGFTAVKTLALTCSLRTIFVPREDHGAFSPRLLWQHSLAAGVISRRIFRHARLPNEEGAFLAGVIHDLGLLVENQCRPGAFETVMRAAKYADVTFIELERRVLDTDHCELGQAVAERWNFPPFLVSVIAHHPAPLEADELFWPLTCAVAVACRAAVGDEPDAMPFGAIEPLSSQVWDVLGLDAQQFVAICASARNEAQSVATALAV